MEKILSSQNSLIKTAMSLAKKKYRLETGLFKVEGVKSVEEAIVSGYDIYALIVTEEVCSHTRVNGLIKTALARGYRVVCVPNTLYAKITEVEEHQGIMVLVYRKDVGLKDISVHEKMLVVVVDRVQDPGNIGTIIRTADAAGCDAVILLNGCADLFAGQVVRASMGSMFNIPIVCDISEAEVVDWLGENGIEMAVATLRDAECCWESDMSAALAIVVGNEGSGVSAKLIDAAQKNIYIPIYGAAESLNVSIAAGVLLYEAARQRKLSV